MINRLFLLDSYASYKDGNGPLIKLGALLEFRAQVFSVTKEVFPFGSLPTAFTQTHDVVCSFLFFYI